MVKLTICIGFLAVFGFVAYALVSMLSNHFKKDNDQINKSINKSSKTKKHEQKDNH